MYDDNGRFLSRAIFWELSPPERREKFPPLYMLGVRPNHGLPSAYQIYMESIDEYDAAIKLVGNMKNWRTLCNASWFMDGDARVGHEGLKNWRLDMEARDKSLAKRQLQVKAEEGSVQAMVKVYNISPADARKLKKEKVKKEKPDAKVVDIIERMNKG